MLLALLFTLVGFVGQCVVLGCCKKSLRAKREKLLQRVIKPSSKICALAWMLVVFVMFAVGAFTSYSGGAIFGSSVSLIGTSATGVLDSSQAVIRRLSPGVNKTFDSINIIVGDAIDAAPSSIDTSRLDNLGVNSNLANLISDLQNISSYIDVAVNEGATASTTYTELSNSISVLSTNVSRIITTISGWDDTNGVAISGGTYRTGYTPSTISFSALNSDFASIPNGRDQMNPIKNIEMSKTISDYTSTSSGLPARITSYIRAANAPTKANLNSAVITAKVSILGAIKSVEDATDRTFDGGRNQLKLFLSSVEGYNSYRSTSMIILSSCIFVIMIVVTFAFFKQKPILVKGCNLCATPLYLFVQLLAIIIFILAVVFGDVCSSVFEYSPAPILEGLDSSFGEPVLQLTLLRDECSNNVSIIQVAVDVKLVRSDEVNITLQLDKTVNLVNLTSIANFTLEPLVWLRNATPSVTPSVIVDPLSNLDLGLLQSSSVDPKILSTNSDLDTITSSLTSVSVQVSSLASTHSGFFYDPDNTGQRNIANSDYNSRSADIISEISIVLGEITALRTKLNNYQTRLTSTLLEKANSAKSAAASWTAPANSHYSSVQGSMRNFSVYAQGAMLTYPPVMKARINSSNRHLILGTSNTEVGLRRNTTCFDLGTSVYTLQDAVCSQFEGIIIFEFRRPRCVMDGIRVDWNRSGFVYPNIYLCSEPFTFEKSCCLY